MAKNYKSLLALGSGIAVLVLALTASAADYRAVAVAIASIGQGDAQKQALIEHLSALDGQPLGTLSTGEPRKLADTTATIASNADRLGWPKVHIYWPQGKGPYPVVVYYNGDSLLVDDHGAAGDSPRAIAKAANAIVVAVQYDAKTQNAGLAATRDDAFAAYQWALANASALGGDPNHVAVMGESSGGALAAAVAVRARDARSGTPLYQALLYPEITPAKARPMNISLHGPARAPGLLRHASLQRATGGMLVALR